MTVVEQLTKKRQDLMNYLGREVGKNPSLAKAFKDLQTLDEALEKAVVNENLAKAANSEQEILKAVGNNKEVLSEYVSELAKAQNVDESFVLDVLEKANISVKEGNLNKACDCDKLEKSFTGKTLKEEIGNIVSAEIDIEDDLVSALAKHYDCTTDDVEDAIADVLED